MATKKYGSPYFKYDDPRDQGRVGITPKGKWLQDYYDPETRVFHIEQIEAPKAETK